MASVHHRHGFSQSMGIGVAVGFVAALVLTAIFVRVTLTFRLKTLQKTLAAIKPGYVYPEPERPVRRPPINNTYFRDGRTDFLSTHCREIPGQRLQAFTTRGCVLNCTGRDHKFGFGIWDFTRCIESDPTRQLSASELKALLDEQKLMDLAGKPVNDGTWTDLISNSKTRRGAIACFLAQLFFRRMHPNPSEDVSETFLPRSMLKYYKELCKLDPEALTYGDCGSGNLWDLLSVFRELRDVRINVTVVRPLVDKLIFSKVVASLHYGEFAINVAWGYQVFKHGDPRREMIDNLKDAIIDALKLRHIISYYAAQDLRLDSHLTHLLEWAANAAIVMFAQPGEYRFDWKSDEEGFLIFPAMYFDLDVYELHTPARVEHMQDGGVLKGWKNKTTEDRFEGKVLVPPRWFDPGIAYVESRFDDLGARALP